MMSSDSVPLIDVAPMFSPEETVVVSAEEELDGVCSWVHPEDVGERVKWVYYEDYEGYGGYKEEREFSGQKLLLGLSPLLDTRVGDVLAANGFVAGQHRVQNSGLVGVRDFDTDLLHGFTHGCTECADCGLIDVASMRYKKNGALVVVHPNTGGLCVVSVGDGNCLVIGCDGEEMLKYSILVWLRRTMAPDLLSLVLQVLDSGKLPDWVYVSVYSLVNLPRDEFSACAFDTFLGVLDLFGPALEAEIPAISGIRDLFYFSQFMLPRWSRALSVFIMCKNRGDEADPSDILRMTGVSGGDLIDINNTDVDKQRGTGIDAARRAVERSLVTMFGRNIDGDSTLNLFYADRLFVSTGWSEFLYNLGEIHD